jgi:hypothetical protein
VLFESNIQIQRGQGELIWDFKSADFDSKPIVYTATAARVRGVGRGE